MAHLLHSTYNGIYMWNKRKEVGKEAGKFSFVGIIATAVDFTLLNLCTIWLGLPIIVANMISATISSGVSFLLNRQLTFNGQRHGNARTIIRYVLIVGISIYVIQNAILYLIGHHLYGGIDAVLDRMEHFGVPHVSHVIVSNNIAKALAAWLASIWNFFMLRRFVFVPTEESEDGE